MATHKMAKNQNGKNPERQKTKTEKTQKGKGLIWQIIKRQITMKKMFMQNFHNAHKIINA